MKKYEYPEIYITSFLCENVVTASAEIKQPIAEVSSLQTMLGDSHAEFQTRIESFQNLIGFSE